MRPGTCLNMTAHRFENQSPYLFLSFSPCHPMTKEKLRSQDFISVLIFGDRKPEKVNTNKCFSKN